MNRAVQIPNTVFDVMTLNRNFHVIYQTSIEVDKRIQTYRRCWSVRHRPGWQRNLWKSFTSIDWLWFSSVDMFSVNYFEEYSLHAIMAAIDFCSLLRNENTHWVTLSSSSSLLLSCYYYRSARLSHFLGIAEVCFVSTGFNDFQVSHFRFSFRVISVTCP